MGSRTLTHLCKESRSFRAGAACFCLFLIAAGPPDTRQVWRGRFVQTAPLPWEGPIEVYLRYESEAPPPQPVDGLLTWPTLGNARVRIRGERDSAGNIDFTEVECLQGDCSKVVMGGRHHLVPEPRGAALGGTAEGSFGLQGSYRLTP